jgi:hypothetical protein
VDDQGRTTRYRAVDRVFWLRLAALGIALVGLDVAMVAIGRAVPSDSDGWHALFVFVRLAANIATLVFVLRFLRREWTRYRLSESR